MFHNKIKLLFAKFDVDCVFYLNSIEIGLNLFAYHHNPDT